MGYHIWDCWLVSYSRNYRLWSLLLVTLQNRVVRSYHRNYHDLSHGRSQTSTVLKIHPFELAFSVIEGAMHVIRREKVIINLLLLGTCELQ